MRTFLFCIFYKWWLSWAFVIKLFLVQHNWYRLSDCLGTNSYKPPFPLHHFKVFPRHTKKVGQFKVMRTFLFCIFDKWWLRGAFVIKLFLVQHNWYRLSDCLWTNSLMDKFSLSLPLSLSLSLPFFPFLSPLSLRLLLPRPVLQNFSCASLVIIVLRQSVCHCWHFWPYLILAHKGEVHPYR